MDNGGLAMPRYYMDLDFDEGSPETYRGILLSRLGDDRIKNPPIRFYSGNATVDNLAAFQYLYNIHGVVTRNSHNFAVMGSSSLDHFVMDGGELRENYTKEELAEAMILAAEVWARENPQCLHTL
jgi:hypothetical protein